jgi:hypothetical protein
MDRSKAGFRLAAGDGHMAEENDGDRALLAYRFDHLMGVLREVKEDLKEISNRAAGMETRVAIIETKAVMWGAIAGLVSSGLVALIANIIARKL